MESSAAGGVIVVVTKPENQEGGDEEERRGGWSGERRTEKERGERGKDRYNNVEVLGSSREIIDGMVGNPRTAKIKLFQGA